AAGDVSQPVTPGRAIRGAALAAAQGAGLAGADPLDGAHRFAHPHRLQRNAAGTGGAAAGNVRQRADAAHRQWPYGARAAPAVAGPAAGAGNPGPGGLLAQQLRRGEEGHEGALPQTLLAGSSPAGRTHHPGHAAQVTGRAYRGCAAPGVARASGHERTRWVASSVTHGRAGARPSQRAPFIAYYARPLARLLPSESPWTTPVRFFCAVPSCLPASGCCWS